MRSADVPTWRDRLRDRARLSRSAIARLYHDGPWRQFVGIRLVDATYSRGRVRERLATAGEQARRRFDRARSWIRERAAVQILIAASLSSLVPGLGQLYQRRYRSAAFFLAPTLALLVVAMLLVGGSDSTRLLLSVAQPSTIDGLLALDALVLAWRLAAVVHAVAGTSPARLALPTMAALTLILAWVTIPQVLAGSYGLTARDQLDRIFVASGDTTPDFTGNLGGEDDPGSTAGPSPLPNERINVLLMGIDSGAGRDHALTDTLIVVSLDPVGKTVSMVSVPRDMVDVPLGNGHTYAPKINSLLAYANTHRDQFPQGGTRAVEDAIGALLGIPIHYFAKVNLAGFVETVNALGGVDVDVAHRLFDPNYGGYGFEPGTQIEAGPQHMDGPTALAYARIRHSTGESDFTRARRQQALLVDIRDQAVKNNLLVSLPSLLASLGDTIRTNLPPDQLPQLATLAQDVGADQAVEVLILGHDMVHPGKDSAYGSVQVPNLTAI